MDSRPQETSGRGIELVRWILVLPAALLAAIVVAFPVHWIVLGTFKSGGLIELSDEGATNVERAVTPFAMSLAFVACGAMTAPRNRFSVALILGALLVLLAAVSYWYVLSNENFRITMPVQGGIGVASFLVGIVTGIVVVKHQHTPLP